MITNILLSDCSVTDAELKALNGLLFDPKTNSVRRKQILYSDTQSWARFDSSFTFALLACPVQVISFVVHLHSPIYSVLDLET